MAQEAVSRGMVPGKCPYLLIFVGLKKWYLPK
jgi:hypothetical protein